MALIDPCLPLLLLAEPTADWWRSGRSECGEVLVRLLLNRIDGEALVEELNAWALPLQPAWRPLPPQWFAAFKLGEERWEGVRQCTANVMRGRGEDARHAAVVALLQRLRRRIDDSEFPKAWDQALGVLVSLAPALEHCHG